MPQSPRLLSDLPQWLRDLGPPNLELHLAHPEVTAEAHVTAKAAELAAKISGKRLIYLDTKFWVLLRDGSLGRPRTLAVADLLAALRTAVHAGDVLCPFAADTFMEVLHQKDRVTRRATAELIDELSQGLTLRPERERQDFEFDDLFVRMVRRRDPAIPLKNRVWIAPGYVVGEMHPFHDSIDPMTLLALQKTFLDALWRLTVTNCIDHFAAAPSPPSIKGLDFAATMNRSHARYASQLTSYAQACATELRGYLELHRPVLKEILRRRYEELALPEKPTAEHLDARSVWLREEFVTAYQKGDLTGYLPTAQIKATLWGALRWDKSRKCKPNDFHDFGHAAAALPYHQVFATEKPLAHLIRQTGLDRTHGTTIVTEAEDLTTFVRQ